MKVEIRGGGGQFSPRILSIFPLIRLLLLFSLSFFLEPLVLAPATTDPSALHSTTTPSSGIATTGVDFIVVAPSTIVDGDLFSALAEAKSMDLEKIDGLALIFAIPSQFDDPRE